MKGAWPGALLLLVAASGSLQASDEDRLRQWVRELDDGRYAVRREAEAALRRQSALMIPLLEKEATNNVEHQHRLERIVGDLRRLPWHHDMGAAQSEARSTGKPLLVFSSIGEAHGFG